MKHHVWGIAGVIPEGDVADVSAMRDDRRSQKFRRLGLRNDKLDITLVGLFIGGPVLSQVEVNRVGRTWRQSAR